MKFPIVDRRAEGQSEHRHLDDDAMDVAGESRHRRPSERTLRRAGILDATATPKCSLLADKLVPQFCAATGFEPAGEPMQSFPGSKIEGIERAASVSGSRTAIVLTADFVTMDTGTGAVHIAPGHGEDDYSLGRTNGLPILSPVDDHGRYTEEAGIARA